LKKPKTKNPEKHIPTFCFFQVTPGKCSPQEKKNKEKEKTEKCVIHHF